jgi:hypothetical protein
MNKESKISGLEKMCKVRYYFFPSLCSRLEREYVYVHVSDLNKKEEKDLKIIDYEKISEKRFINYKECSRCL